MIYDLEINRRNGSKTTMREYEGKVLLIVNTASKCGFTPQFEGLEKLYEKYKEEGFEVLGFPCNQFLNQDPGTEDEIASFCQLNYGVSFEIFQKINVNGKNASPLFKFLKKEKGGMIKWNFTKFLIDREGNVIKRFSPNTEPSALLKPIEALL